MKNEEIFYEIINNSKRVFTIFYIIFYIVKLITLIDETDY